MTHEEYTLGTAAASSLIGNVGSDSGTQINLSFLNILLPDKSAEEAGGIFTHATYWNRSDMMDLPPLQLIIFIMRTIIKRINMITIK